MDTGSLVVATMAIVGILGYVIDETEEGIEFVDVSLDTRMQESPAQGVRHRRLEP